MRKYISGFVCEILFLKMVWRRVNDNLYEIKSE